jgi:hypothetical protein
VCPQSPFGVLKIMARKQIELATRGLWQIIVKLFLLTSVDLNVGSLGSTYRWQKEADGTLMNTLV